MDRRKFLRIMGMAGAATALPWTFVTRAFPFAQSPVSLTKFADTLPGVGPGGANSVGQYLTVLSPTTATFKGVKTDVYHITVNEFTQKMHPDLPATSLWGYADNKTGIHKYLGGVIVARRNRPVLLYVTNSLPLNKLLPVDPTLPAGTMVTNGDVPINRIATHLHGGFTPWISDGTPFQWFTPSGAKDSSGSLINVPGTFPAPGTATHYYTNRQSARLMWYHDHAMGITRTNAYAGIASAFVLLDNFEIGLVTKGLLPDLVGIPLVIQDKTFVDTSTIGASDPTWAAAVDAAYQTNGSLWYPHVYEANSLPNGAGRWDYGPDVSPPATGVLTPLPDPGNVPEFFADTILVNGAAYPVAHVPPKRVRFRLLNGSQARFYHLNLFQEDTTPGEANTNRPGPPMIQIGTEGGFLPAVALHRNGIPCPRDLTVDPTGNTVYPYGPFNLLLAPAERADIIIDFNGKTGTNYILYSDAPAPFPSGDPRNDYYTGDPDFTDAGNNPYGLSGGAPSTAAGFGPNTRTLMKIVVDAGTGDATSTVTVINQLNAKLKAAFLTGEQPLLLYHDKRDPSVPGPVPVDPSYFPKGTVIRNLTLNEDFDEYGRLIQREGTTTQNGTNNQGLPTWGRNYMDAATESPKKNAVEVWNIYNLTGDTHPIHFHLVNVQVIQRALFDAIGPTFAPIPGTERAPDPNELGWKETVRMNGVIPEEDGFFGEVTTVIVKFVLPPVPFAVPSSPRFTGQFPGKKPQEYVWHCHILDHEEHDMMRPLVVLA